MGNNFEYGDIIRVDRGIYYHYGVYADDRTVYQYANRQGCEIDGNATVHCTTLENFARGGKVQKLEFSNMLAPNKITVMEDQNDAPKIKSVSEYLQYVKNICKSLALNPFEFMKMLKDIKSDYRIYTPEQTITRAESRLGESAYNLALNNCESYAMWCKTGVNISYQTMSALLLLGPIFSELMIARYAVAAYSLVTVDVFALPTVIKKQFEGTSLAKDIEYIRNYMIGGNENKEIK